MVVPVCLTVGWLAWRDHPAAPVLALARAIFAMYTYSQLILGNEYLHRPGTIERFFSLLLAMFLLAATVAMRRWGLARLGRRSAHFSTRKTSARGWPQTWEGSYRRILKLSTRIGRVTGDDSASPSGEGSVLTWTAVILPSRGLSRGLSGHRLCAHVTVKPYARVGWVRSTAAKCSSGATLPRYAESPSAALACSTPVGDNLARGSGRRGRRFKSCHPDFRRARTRPRTDVGAWFQIAGGLNSLPSSYGISPRFKTLVTWVAIAALFHWVHLLGRSQLSRLNRAAGSYWRLRSTGEISNGLRDLHRWGRRWIS